MNPRASIDTTFDFRTDTPEGKDPDKFSPTLRRFHRLLWSKPLPCGSEFHLVETTPRTYLHHRSDLGEFWLASDAVVPSFTRNKHVKPLIEDIPAAELDAFNTIGYSIGGMMLWPGNRVEGKMTINGARGFHPRLKDRFDLSLECVRLYYAGLSAPLEDTLARHADFFGLFESFHGFVKFFLLQDLVSPDLNKVRTMLPFQGFDASPLPQTTAEYLAYKRSAIAFIEARNKRILEWSKSFVETPSQQ